MVELFRLEDSVQRFFIVSSKNYVKAYFRMCLCKNLSLGIFLGCSHFFTISEADVLMNSVLIKIKIRRVVATCHGSLKRFSSCHYTKGHNKTIRRQNLHGMNWFNDLFSLHHNTYIHIHIQVIREFCLNIGKAKTVLNLFHLFHDVTFSDDADVRVLRLFCWRHVNQSIW